MVNGKLVKVGKYDILVRKVPSFWKWLEGRMDRKEFESLPKEEKIKIFYRYKWGISNDKSNESAEQSEKDILRMIKGLTPEQWKNMDKGMRVYLKLKIKWNEYCDSVLKEILKEDEFVEKVKEEFEAKDSSSPKHISDVLEEGLKKSLTNSSDYGKK